jgi:hypothetical protein
MALNKVIFTIITKSYLAYVKVMAKELRARNPQIPFYVFLADRPDGYFQPEQELFIAIPLEDFLPAELIPTMTGYYTAYEFCNALKPFAHLYLATKIRVERWFYLDSDIFVCDSFDSLFEKLDNCSILLTGHILKPVELEISEQLELSFLRAGIYNGGFVGLKNTMMTMNFLAWWKQRLIWHCLSDKPGLEADQSWLNFVPVLFPEVKVLKNPEVNVAYWNFHERELELDANNDVRVAGARIPFLHFSGWNWREPETISKFASPDMGNSVKAWNHIRDTYRQRLLDESVKTTSTWPYSFGKTADGQEISPSMRRKFLIYCREHIGEPLKINIFSNPEFFRDPPQSRPKPISLTVATRTFAGALLRALKLRK